MSDKATAAAVEEIKDRPENTGTPIPAANGDVREPESGTAVYDTPEDSEKRRDNGGEDRERETHSKPRVRVKKRRARLSMVFPFPDFLFVPFYHFAPGK